MMMILRWIYTIARGIVFVNRYADRQLYREVKYESSHSWWQHALQYRGVYQKASGI